MKKIDKAHIKIYFSKTKQFIGTIILRLKLSIPRKVRKLLSYLIRLKWLMRAVTVKNTSYSRGKPLVTIVTPYYNAGDTINETVESVLRQTFQNYEYIIVNDGSSKKDTEILHRINNKKIKIIEHPFNKGKGSPAVTRNTGIAAAKGKYIICLDADDVIASTYVEKLLVTIETDPGVSVVTTNLRLFGENEGSYDFESYQPRKLIKRNYLSTASIFLKSSWEKVGGYTEGIGYEDWEFWIKLAENGYWGKNIHETILGYRVVKESRFTEDLKKHRENKKTLQQLHPNYKNKIGKIFRKNYFYPKVADKNTAFINLCDSSSYQNDLSRTNILLLMPWMAFGGAETLIYNYTKEIKSNFNISFITTLKGDNPWEYKFSEVSESIYHLPNLFEDRDMYIEFIINYIRTRNIQILHGLHIGYDYNIFQYLPRIRKEFPDLKIMFTFFNAGVPLFDESLQGSPYVDCYVSDNNRVALKYKEVVPTEKAIVIPNGIDSTEVFNRAKYDVSSIQSELGLRKEEMAVFFVGRLSEEKKPDVFVDVASKFATSKYKDNVKFILIGDGPMKNELTSKMSKLKNTKYLGYQPVTEVARYLSAADVFVLPSRIEGFPLSILEAMAMEVTVVASDVGAVSEIIENGEDGFVVAPSSVEEIYQSIVQLVENRSMLNRMKIKSREKVESRYSNVILGKNYTKLYNEVMK